MQTRGNAHFLKLFYVLVMMGSVYAPSVFAADNVLSPPTPPGPVVLSPDANQLLSLSADWWKGLASQNQAQRTRDIAAFLANLKRLQSQQPVASQTNYEGRIDNIVANFGLWQTMLDKQLAAVEPAAPLKEGYTWKTWLQLMHDMQKQQAQAEQAQQDKIQAQQSQNELERQADSSTAKYLAVQPETDRFSALLDMLEKRLAWLINRETLRLQTAQDQVAQAKALAARTAFITAQQRLQIGADDVEALQQELQALTPQMDKAGEQLRAAQAKVAVMIGEGELARAQANLAQVELLAAQSLVDQLQSRQWWLQIAQTYLQIKAQSNPLSATRLNADIDNWQRALKDLSAQNQDRQTQLSIKREKLQTTSLLVSQDDGLDDKTQARVQHLYSSMLKSVAALSDDLQTTKAQLLDGVTVLALVDTSLSRQQGVFKSQWLDIQLSVVQGWQTIVGWLETSLFKIGETPVTTAGILRVFIIITLVWWFSYWLRKAFLRVARRNQDKIATATAYTINRVMHYLIMIIGIIVALSSIGLDFSNIAWIAGALSVGIGFGLQSIVNNFVSGLIIMFERSLKIGDFIELQSGVTGTVTHINMRSTIVATTDNIEIVVPNSEFISGRVVNWTLSDKLRRIRIPFGVDYGTDKEKVVQAVMAAALKVPFTYPDKEPQVWMTSMGNNALEFELLVWIKHGIDDTVDYRLGGSNQGIRAAYMWEVESALTAAGISIPYPQQDLYIRSILGVRTPEALAQQLQATSHKLST